MDQKEIRQLAEKALDMRNMSYVPYSGFAVGAALLCEDGSVFGGCNIENAGYTPSNCAERTAIFSAVASGRQKFTALAVAGGKKGEEPEDYCAPCGVCRQVMSEFCDSDFPVYLVKSAEDIQALTLGDLLPHSFTSASLH